MIKWFFSYAGYFSLLLSMASTNQSVMAGEFAVATRDQVLTLTSQIQATQFLTHATFGATQAEIDALAAQMRSVGTIKAASDWIDARTGAYNASIASHSRLELQMMQDDLDLGKYYDRSGSGQSNYTYIEIGNTPRSDVSFNTTDYRVWAWWHRALAHEDPLRQKMAWALSQIFSVGGGDNAPQFEAEVVNGPQNRSRYMGATDYYDIFVVNAFQTYRRVLGEVTYHARMGDWLSSRGNRRAQNGDYPDENYAREVMQLFSIGLDLLNDDGRPTGFPNITPTYDADDIREYAQIFTGLGYGYGTLVTTSTAYSPYTGTVATQPNNDVKFQVPMRMAPQQHDRSAKWLLNGLKLPSTDGSIASIDVGINSATLHTEATANAEIDQALDGLIAHQSCPPFVCNKLIQRFIKSNPSRAYMNRVVNVYKNNGSGIRGDLKAVIKAVLLDPEAWQPIRVQYQRAPINRFVVTTMGTEDSRLQEPIVSCVRFNRFFNATAEYQVGYNVGSVFIQDTATPTGGVGPGVLNNQFRYSKVSSTTFGQSPHAVPTVFGFFDADYQPAGHIANYVSPSGRMQREVIFAPEFKIVNSITSNLVLNFYRKSTDDINNSDPQLVYQTDPSLLPAPHPNYSTQYAKPNGQTIVATKSTRSILTLDFDVERTLIQLPVGRTYAQRQAAARALTDRLDLYLCGGTLPQAYKVSLTNAALAEMNLAATGDAGSTANGTSGIGGSEVKDIVRGVVMATLASPGFLVTE